MSEAKFTKGPWIYDESSGEVVHDDISGRVICDVMPVFEQHDKDGYLIAAAPEMYEMLDKLSVQLTEINAHDAVNEIERLLKKARGDKQ